MDQTRRSRGANLRPTHASLQYKVIRFETRPFKFSLQIIKKVLPGFKLGFSVLLYQLSYFGR